MLEKIMIIVCFIVCILMVYWLYKIKKNEEKEKEK